MLPAEEQKTRVALEKAWYGIEEIEKVLQGMREIQAGKFFSAEDVYKRLHAKRKIHA